MLNQVNILLLNAKNVTQAFTLNKDFSITIIDK